MDRTVKIKFTEGFFDFRKWDVIKAAGSPRKMIVISVNKFEDGIVTIISHRYWESKYRLLQWGWFQWLKFKIWIGIIKTKP